MKYFTQIHVRSSRGKNKRGRKVSGIDLSPRGDAILVTSNDSRIRLYALKDFSLMCKYKGLANTSSQIQATFSPDGKSIISGSEDQRFYTWNLQPPGAATASGGGIAALGSKLRKSAQRRDRNEDYQRFDAHEASCTVACFVPPVQGVAKKREVLLSADYNGTLKVYIAYQFERT